MFVEFDAADGGVAADEVDDLLDGFGLLEHIFHVDEVVLRHRVFMLRQREGYRGRLVVAVLHFVDVPASVEVARIHDAHVGPHAFHLLVVPQGEGVRQAGHQVVVADIARHVAVAAVVVVPVLCRQYRRYAAAYRSGYRGGRHVVFAGQFSDPLPDAHHTQPYPDGEGIERTGINVIPFTRFGRGLVEVEDQRDAHHDEEPHHHGEVLRVAVELVNQTDDAENEGEEVVFVAPLVVGHLRG